MTLLQHTNLTITQILLLEESEQYNVFSDDERQELIFRLFAHLAIGGPLNQVTSLLRGSAHSASV